MAQILVTQNELLRQLLHSQQQGGRRHHQPQSSDYQDFLGTQPPLFSPSDNPLKADAWIRTIESKFSLLTAPCSEANKVKFASQQLRDAARLWWDHLVSEHPTNHQFTWAEFKNAFLAHHVPAGLLDRKLSEFLVLTQGTRTVPQYAQ
jgi:hypothetical protein